jgi:SAM-dependent methyltransferase
MASPTDSLSPSDHLLRTLASVPVSSSVLDLGCGQGRHTEPLLRLGFPVHACDPEPAAVDATRTAIAPLVGEDTAETCVQTRPLSELASLDESFDWIVGDRAERYATTPDELTRLLEAARALLSPGGWLFVTVPTAASNEDADASSGLVVSEAQLERCRDEAGLEVANAPSQIDEPASPRLRALYRRVDPKTPG